MAGDQDSATEYIYYLRNKVYWLGKLYIDFHGDPENVECICSRVLLNSGSKTKRKSKVNVTRNLHPIVDQLTFPAPEILDRASVKDNGIGDNVNEITVDSTIDNSDENHLISSDTDEDISCCCFTKIMKNLSKKVRRRRKEKKHVDKTNVEKVDASDNVPAEPEPILLNGETSVAVNLDNDNTPVEYHSKLPENGITHMGYAFTKPKHTLIREISWEYDVNRINQWNEPLRLQTAAKPSTSNSIDWWYADPEQYRNVIASVKNVDSDVASLEHAEPAAKRKRNREEATNNLIVDPTIVLSNFKFKPTAAPWRSGRMPDDIAFDREMMKYWRKRYQLFSLYDEGILLDRESWYSVTAEEVSKHIADRCRCGIIIDGFCGAGGNTIQFAFTCSRVIAIDIDPEKIKMAKHNAAIYEVENQIDFIVGDFFKIVPLLKADVVFLSPPWGGPGYRNLPSFPMDSLCSPHGGKEILEVARRLTDNIAFYLPKNINTMDIIPICKPDRTFELEQNLVNGKLEAITAYFGELVQDNIPPT